MSSFIPQNLTEIEAITGRTFACVCNTVFRMFSCLQINCQPFYLRQLLKFHQFDWLIEIYGQTEGQGTHHKMVSLQPMSGFSPLLIAFTENCFANVLSEPWASHCDCRPEHTEMACVSSWMSGKETSTIFSQGERLIRRCSNCWKLNLPIPDAGGSNKLIFDGEIVRS